MNNLPYPLNRPMLRVNIKNQKQIFHLTKGDTIEIEVALNAGVNDRSGYVDIDIDSDEIGLILDGDAPSGKKLIFEINYKYVDM